jgi:hypothetical protein
MPLSVLRALHEALPLIVGAAGFMLALCSLASGPIMLGWWRVLFDLVLG